MIEFNDIEKQVRKEISGQLISGEYCIVIRFIRNAFVVNQ